MRDKAIDSLVAATRVPLADLADKVRAAGNDERAVAAAVEAAAQGLAAVYSGAVVHWVAYGRRQAAEGVAS